MTLPINDLKRHNAPLDPELRSAIGRVLERGYYVLGPENKAFEQEFAAYLGTPDAVGVGNGTDALELALRAAGVGPGREVVTVANAGMYASTAIRATGATPVYVDVRADTLLVDPDLLAAAITPATGAIVVTHLYGRMADVERLVPVAHQRGIPVIEDCAQAHGARRQGRAAGSWGDLAAFSFYPTKNLGALGDGGLVTGQDPALLARVRHLRQYGWTTQKYECREAGGRNSRLDEIQAAVLRVKLPHLDAWNQRRRAIVSLYREGLKDIGWQLPPAPAEDDVAHLCVVRPRQRDTVRAVLQEHGIGSDVHYPIPDHLQPAYADEGRPALPVTEDAARGILSLPCFPEMTNDEVATVIQACRIASQKECPK
ncbi:DegT/DnrJ/EryC1/StrS aminotransferase family protein [Zoogloea sp. LCSB751]|uniref:DegT/DnrJ/EryC1/StrS family aminotransferase n=1 Tax=Zoogloea sp. LCSB751 TaxID=1965277 RepID=UPI0009A4E151|nr:DegT/DnrJ/EryC1/StrS family aminotransferase [Zoogloea sp. LCSB751]